MVDIPDPVGHGWEKEGEMVRAQLMKSDCAPKSLLVVISCNCIKSECRGRCLCLREGQPCTDSCSCGSGEICKNPRKASNSPQLEDDDDEESEESEAESELV